MVALRWMDGNSGRLVDHQDILIFIHNGKGKGDRDDIMGGFLLRKCDPKPFTGLKAVYGKDRDVVNNQSLRILLKMHHQMMGIAAGF